RACVAPSLDRGGPDPGRRGDGSTAAGGPATRSRRGRVRVLRPAPAAGHPALRGRVQLQDARHLCRLRRHPRRARADADGDPCRALDRERDRDRADVPGRPAPDRHARRRGRRCGVCHAHPQPALALLAGTFGSFWFWTFTYAYHYGTGEPLAQGVKNLWTALGLILPTCYLAVALSALGLSAVAWDPVTRSRFAPVGLLLLCGVTATSAGLYFRHQYFILLLPAVTLLAGLAVDAVTRRPAMRDAPTLRAALAIEPTAVPLLHPVYLDP